MEKQWVLDSGQMHPPTHTHTYIFALQLLRNVKEHITLSVSDSIWGCIRYGVEQEPSPCKMYHHRTRHPEHSGAPTASKQSSQTGAAGCEHSSNTATHPLATFLPPSHHYERVSCLKATRSIWKGQKCLLETQCRIIAEEMLRLLLRPQARMCLSAVQRFTQSGAQERERNLLNVYSNVQ